VAGVCGDTMTWIRASGGVVALGVVSLALAIALRHCGLLEQGPGGVRAARAAWLAGESGAARQRARASLPSVRREVAALPTDLDRRLALAETLALAGEAELALVEAERAVALDPAPAGSRADGAARRESALETLAVVALEAGATARAEAALGRLAALGGGLSVGSDLLDPRRLPRGLAGDSPLVSAHAAR
jgi:hypothetical protein